MKSVDKSIKLLPYKDLLRLISVTSACLLTTAATTTIITAPATASSSAVAELLKQGDDYLESGRYQEAAKIYQDALKSAPDDPNVHNMMGICYLRMNQPLEGAGEFRKSLEIDPEFLPGLNNLGSTMYRKGDYEAAIGYYEQELGIKGGEDAEVHTNLASVYRDRATFAGGAKRNADYQKALEHYQRALAIDNHYAPAFNNLGLCYLRTRHFEEARREIKRALAIKEDYAAAYFNLGLVEQARSNLPAALAAFQKSLRYETVPAYIQGTRKKIKDLRLPETSSDPFSMGYDLLCQKKYDQAEEQFRQVIASTGGKNNAVAWNNLGLALAKQGRLQEAISAYKQAIAKQPAHFPAAQYNLGQALRSSGDLARAQQCFQTALTQAHGTHALAHNALGLVFKQTGDLKNALAQYKLAILQSGDTLPVVHYNLGLILEKQPGKAKDAATEFSRYISQYPNGVNTESARSRIKALNTSESNR